MDIHEQIRVDVHPQILFPVLADLEEYPHWLSIVSRVRPTADRRSPDSGHTGHRSWIVDLQGSIGPLRRSKRLRMVRSECLIDQRIVFEREELDGKKHSPWVLTVELQPVNELQPVKSKEDAHQDQTDASIVTVQLHYGGNLWIPLLDRLLEDEIRSSSQRLRQLIEKRAL